MIKINNFLIFALARDLRAGALFLSITNKNKGQIMQKNKLYIVKNDFDKIVFCGNKSAIYNFLIAGNNNLLSTNYNVFDFENNFIKTFTTK